MTQEDEFNGRIRNFILERFPLARNRNINCEEQLLDRGILDSMGVLEVVEFIEHEFRVSFSDEDLQPENFQSISRLASFVQTKLQDHSASIEGV